MHQNYKKLKVGENHNKNKHAWKQRKLGDLFEQQNNFVNPKEHNIELYSLTVQEGLTQKTDRYNREFLTKSEDKFKEVKTGEVVYNPMNMTLGAIGFNNLGKSVAVSGYYVILSVNSEFDLFFMKTWMKSPSAIMLYKNNATGTLKEKQRVQYSTFSSIEAMFPSLEEQKRIGLFLDKLDSTITLQQRKLNSLQKLKKGLLQKMFPKNGENIPEIRFPEFSDAWKQCKLGEVAEYKKGFAFKSEDYIDNGIKIIRVSDLGKDTIKETGEVCILPEKSKQYEPWILRENDLIVTTVGSKPPVWDSLVGKAIYVSQMFDGSLLNQNAIRVRVKTGNNQVFLRYIFTKDYVDYIQTIIRGNANQGSITVEDLFKYNFRICSLKEQEKIGSFFAQLDNTITLQQRKLNSLQKLKKGLLQKMFPKNGENIPEIRFPEFSDAWKQRKLGDLFEQQNNFVNPKEHNIELYSLTVQEGLTQKTDRYNREFLTKSEDKFKEVKTGEVVYNPMNMTLGAIGFNNLGKSVAVSGYYVILSVNSEFDLFFMKTWMKSPSAIMLYKNNATGTLKEKQRVQYSTFSSIEAMFPSLEEQKRIGLFLDKLDSTITLQQRKLESLQKLKKGLLQQMFI